MKILFISEYFPPKIMGGGEINLSLIAKSLALEGQEVSVPTSVHPQLSPFEEKDKVKIYRRLKTGSSPSGIGNSLKRSFLFQKSVVKETLQLFLEQKFDLIHFVGTSIIAARQLRRLNTPLFATIESYPALCPKGDRMYQGKEECSITCSLQEFIVCQSKCSEIGKNKNKWYLKYSPFSLLYIYAYYQRLNQSLKHCTLIAISQYVQKLLQKQGVESVVIPNIIESGLLYHQERKTGKLKILYLGSLTHYKGPQVLLEAIQEIDCRLDLYGEGPLQEELQNIIKDTKLDAEIHPPVPYEEVPQLYAETDMVVFPSLWPEPFGRIPLEALLAGKRVIASETGGVKEIAALKGIVMFKPGEPLELRKKIIEVSLNRANKVKNIEGYSPKEITTKILKVYNHDKNKLSPG